MNIFHGVPIPIAEYKLSKRTQNSLQLMKSALTNNILEADPAWTNIFGKFQDEDSSEDVNAQVVINESEKIESDKVEENLNSSNLYSTTQFHFTQNHINYAEIERCTSGNRNDIVQSLLECLEHCNGKLDINMLESVNEDEILEILNDLEKKLTLTGTYNLCRSLTTLNLEQKTKFCNLIFSQVLLPKILELKEPSRLLTSAIAECTEKIPNDISNFLFIPLLKENLSDAAIPCTIATALDIPKRKTLIEQYASSVQEMKLWHIQFLQNGLSIKLDDCVTKKRLIHLFSNNARNFSEDENFGKLMLLFIKTNIMFSDEEKDLLWEIVTSHQTLFNKPLISLLKKM